MNDEYRNYSVLVTQTQQLQVQVMARDEASACETAQAMALRSHFASTALNAEIRAEWPQFEPEEGPVVSDEPGYVWRRGWFWVARLDFRGVALTAEELFSKNPQATALDPRSLNRAFKPLVQSTNETIFGVERRYGHAYRLEGDTLWSDLHASERDARRAARREVKTRAEKAKFAVFFAQLAEAKRRMLESGNAHSLFKTKGGRWSVKSVIGDTTNPGAIVLDDDAWSVDIKVVRALIAGGDAEVYLTYSTSGDPLAIRLSDSAINPF